MSGRRDLVVFMAIVFNTDSLLLYFLFSFPSCYSISFSSFFLSFPLCIYLFIYFFIYFFFFSFSPFQRLRSTPHWPHQRKPLPRCTQPRQNRTFWARICASCVEIHRRHTRHWFQQHTREIAHRHTHNSPAYTLERLLWRRRSDFHRERSAAESHTQTRSSVHLHTAQFIHHRSCLFREINRVRVDSARIPRAGAAEADLSEAVVPRLRPPQQRQNHTLALCTGTGHSGPPCRRPETADALCTLQRHDCAHRRGLSGVSARCRAGDSGRDKGEERGRRRAKCSTQTRNDEDWEKETGEGTRVGFVGVLFFVLFFVIYLLVVLIFFIVYLYHFLFYCIIYSFLHH